MPGRAEICNIYVYMLWCWHKLKFPFFCFWYINLKCSSGHTLLCFEVNYCVVEDFILLVLHVPEMC